MESSKEYHDYIVECLSKVGDITPKKMMGEYSIYYKGKLAGDGTRGKFCRLSVWF